MLHKPVADAGPDHASDYKSKTGVWMFLVYTLVYAGFVAINVINPLLMEARVFLGLNLAVTYGFGLIVLALILALIYNRMCGAREAVLNPPDEKASKTESN